MKKFRESTIVKLSGVSFYGFLFLVLIVSQLEVWICMLDWWKEGIFDVLFCWNNFLHVWIVKLLWKAFQEVVTGQFPLMKKFRESTIIKLSDVSFYGFVFLVLIVSQLEVWICMLDWWKKGIFDLLFCWNNFLHVWIVKLKTSTKAYQIFTIVFWFVFVE